MKKTLLMFVAAACAAARLSAVPTTVDGYAAIVNDHVVTVGEVMEAVRPVEEEIRKNHVGAERAAKSIEAYSNAVHLLVEQRLIIEEFKKIGGVLPDRAVNDRVNETIADRFHNNRAEFLKALAGMHMTYDEYREDVRDRLIVTTMRRTEVVDKIRVTPAQVVQVYEKDKATRFTTASKTVKLSVIVLRKGSDAERRRQDAVLLRGRILGGESFGDMARQFSEDAKAHKGGNWGWMEFSELRRELQDALAKIKPGDITQVLDCGDDFLIVRFDESRDAGVQRFEDVRQQIEDELRQVEGERLYSAWIARLKNKHHVEIFPTSDK